MGIFDKKFTTRKWGFGSNIVNFIKSAVYCSQFGSRLLFQDRFNTISTDFELFSIVDLPANIVRTEKNNIFPIENLKTLIKFLISSESSFFVRLYSLGVFILNRKNDLFLQNFNLDNDINTYFKNNISILRGDVINSVWKYNSKTLAVFDNLNKVHNYNDYVPHISIQIRGGDKNKERKEQGFSELDFEIYYDELLLKIKDYGNIPLRVYVMTDTYNYFKIIKKRISISHPNVEIRSLVSQNNEGYNQLDFNELDSNTKISSYYFFLYEIEILRSAQVCIGSFNSNIFYLAYILGDLDAKFFSVDSNFEESFL